MVSGDSGGHRVVSRDSGDIEWCLGTRGHGVVSVSRKATTFFSRPAAFVVSIPTFRSACCWATCPAQWSTVRLTLKGISVCTPIFVVAHIVMSAALHRAS